MPQPIATFIGHAEQHKETDLIRKGVLGGYSAITMYGETAGSHEASHGLAFSRIRRS